MHIEYNLLIANLISFIAAIFTTKSSLAKDTWHIYFYQVLQCIFLSIASVFFNSYAGIITLAVCALRNYLLAVDKFNHKWFIATLLLLLIPGILINNRGYIGYIVIAANLIYTVGTYFCKKELTIKINIAVDLLMWIIYEFLILDIPSLVADSIALFAAFYSICQLIKTSR